MHEKYKIGSVVLGYVTGIKEYGIFVQLDNNTSGLIHISEISKDFIKHPSEALKVGDVVKVKVIGVDLNKNRISLTIKGCSEVADMDEK